jgi:hypothetical protein
MVDVPRRIEARKIAAGIAKLPELSAREVK